MKKYAILIASLLAFFSAQAQDTVASSYRFTLVDCFDYAVSHSYGRKSIQLSGESQKITYEQSKLQRLPSLNGSVGESMSNSSSGTSASGNLGLSSSVTLYQGGSIRNTIEQNRLSVDRSDVQLLQYDNQLATKILQSFLTVLGNEELLKYQEEVVKTSGEQLKQGRSRYNAGSILESDFLLLEAQYYSDSNSMVDTRVSRDNSLMDLKVLLSIDPTFDFDIIHPDTDNLETLITSLPAEKEAIGLAIENYPDLKLYDYDIKIAQKGIDIAKANYYPSIGASASVGTGFQNFNNIGNQIGNGLNESIGVSMSIPIYSRGATKVSVKKSEISLKQAQLDYDQSVLDVRQSVSQAYRNVVSAYNSYRVSEITENAYKKSFDAYAMQYKYGSITTVELLQQQNNYLNALNNYIQDKYSLLLQRKVLDVYMGEDVTL